MWGIWISTFIRVVEGGRGHLEFHIHKNCALSYIYRKRFFSSTKQACRFVEHDVGLCRYYKKVMWLVVRAANIQHTELLG